jgi:hypothetical protein
VVGVDTWNSPYQILTEPDRIIDRPAADRQNRFLPQALRMGSQGIPLACVARASGPIPMVLGTLSTGTRGMKRVIGPVVRSDVDPLSNSPSTEYFRTTEQQSHYREKLKKR